MPKIDRKRRGPEGGEHVGRGLPVAGDATGQDENEADVHEHHRRPHVGFIKFVSFEAEPDDVGIHRVFKHEEEDHDAAESGQGDQNQSHPL